MRTTRPDITEILEREKEYYAEQIRRINNALAALKGDLVNTETTTKPKKTRTVQWTAEIKELFDAGIEVTTDELRNKLAEKGIVEALESSGKNSVYATVSRLSSGGYLEKTDDGMYRKKQRKIRRRISLEEKNNEITEEKLDET